MTEGYALLQLKLAHLSSENQISPSAVENKLILDLFRNFNSMDKVDAAKSK